jgi:hypothetical protein
LTKNEENEEIRGIIRTVCAPICSSEISIFDSNWYELPFTIQLPKPADWIVTEEVVKSNQSVDEILNVFDVFFWEYGYNPNNQSIEVKNNSLQYLDEFSQKKVEQFINQEVISISLNVNR